MRQLLLIAVCFLALSAFAQKELHDVSIDFGLRADRSNYALGGSINFQFRPTIRERYHFFSVGTGAFFSPGDQWIMDSKATVAFADVGICHMIWWESYPTWYVAGHLRNTFDFSKANFALELGRNIRLCVPLFLVPSAGYDFISIPEGKTWKDNFYAALNLRFLFYGDLGPTSVPNYFIWNKPHYASSPPQE